jgi:hypothetical protein
MYSVSNRAKLRRPPGRGGGSEDRRRWGWPESEVDVRIGELTLARWEEW